MAKVSPLYGRRNYNWELRLTTLVGAIGRWAMNQAEDGASRVSSTITRRGKRFMYSSRIYGRAKHTETGIQFRHKDTHILITCKNGKLIEVFEMIAAVDLTDYKTVYKLLERQVYAYFAKAGEIMSIGDDWYDAIEGK